MKQHYKKLGTLCLILGLISMFLLLAKGFNFYEIENTRVFGLLVFIAVSFPAVGIKFIKKK